MPDEFVPVSVRTTVPLSSRIVTARGGGRRRLQVVVDRRPVLRVLARGRVVVRRRRRGDRPEPIRRRSVKRCESFASTVGVSSRSGAEVVHDPEAAAVRRDHEVVEVLLHHDARHRRVRQVVLQRLPQLAVIERDVDRVLGADVEHAATLRVLVDDLRVAQHALRDAVRRCSSTSCRSPSSCR